MMAYVRAFVIMLLIVVVLNALGMYDTLYMFVSIFFVSIIISVVRRRRKAKQIDQIWEDEKKKF